MDPVRSGLKAILWDASRLSPQYKGLKQVPREVDAFHKQLEAVEVSIKLLSDQRQRVGKRSDAESEVDASRLPWVRSIQDEYAVLQELYEELEEVLGSPDWQRLWRLGLWQGRMASSAMRLREKLPLLAACCSADAPTLLLALKGNFGGHPVNEQPGGQHPISEHPGSEHPSRHDEPGGPRQSRQDVLAGVLRGMCAAVASKPGGEESTEQQVEALVSELDNSYPDSDTLLAHANQQQAELSTVSRIVQSSWPSSLSALSDALLTVDASQAAYMLSLEDSGDAIEAAKLRVQEAADAAAADLSGALQERNTAGQGESAASQRVSQDRELALAHTAALRRTEAESAYQEVLDAVTAKRGPDAAAALTTGLQRGTESAAPLLQRAYRDHERAVLACTTKVRLKAYIRELKAAGMEMGRPAILAYASRPAPDVTLELAQLELLKRIARATDDVAPTPTVARASPQAKVSRAHPIQADSDQIHEALGNAPVVALAACNEIGAPEPNVASEDDVGGDAAAAKSTSTDLGLDANKQGAADSALETGADVSSAGRVSVMDAIEAMSLGADATTPMQRRFPTVPAQGFVGLTPLTVRGSDYTPTEGDPSGCKPADLKYRPGEATFTLEELRGMSGSDGIDMAAKEAYLSEADFVSVFGVERAHFKGLAAWRKTDHKKRVGLF